MRSGIRFQTPIQSFDEGMAAASALPFHISPFSMAFLLVLWDNDVLTSITNQFDL
jgi:hypothetical protein